MSNLTKVFVYGTLLSGEYNNRLLTTSKLLGPAMVTGLEMHNLGSFPACVVADETSVVFGEIWEVNEETFARLDLLEGYPDFYNRIQVEAGGDKAWVYVNENAKNRPLISGGDWKNR